MDFKAVDQALENASVRFSAELSSSNHSRQFVFPGGELLVGQGGAICYHKTFGCRSLEPTVTELGSQMVFDVASLTKAIVTTTLVMKLVATGELGIDSKLSELLSNFNDPGKERMTVRHLLNHSSGYSDYQPFYKIIEKLNTTERPGILGTRDAAQVVYSEIFHMRTDHLPGKVSKYSDIGFMLLGDLLEVVTGTALDKLAVEHIFGPLQLQNMGFVDIAEAKAGEISPVTEVIVPTNDCRLRGGVVCGEVQDENAWAMGGVAGHAGLFATALDIHSFSSQMIDCYQGRSDFLSSDIVQSFWKRDESVPASTWALGWDTPNKGGEGSSAGEKLSRQAVGHLGYTGCSLWIDPEREIDIVFLTNRVHPSKENNKIREFRPKLHDLVMDALL